MALAALATSGDLANLGIDVSDSDMIDDLLASASAAVRDAAGCSITTTTGTVTIGGNSSQWLAVPGWAISEVTAVAIDDETVTDFKLIDGRLWRKFGWSATDEPSNVTLTYTQGLSTVPADITNLVCSLVAAGIAAAEDGYNPHRGDSSVRIDDYQRSFTRGEDEVVAPMELPERTRSWLASRFGRGLTTMAVSL